MSNYTISLNRLFQWARILFRTSVFRTYVFVSCPKALFHFKNNPFHVTVVVPELIRVAAPQTYDGYASLHTQHSMYLNGGILSVECES